VYAYSFLHGNREGDWDESSNLPIRQPASPIAGSPPAVATPLVPRYAELVQRGHRAPGRRRSGAFRGLRFELKYPPLGSTAVLRFDLPDRH
jgi:hypothetical protein